jgi:CMP-N-acetylneuraminic acid synthetase
VNNITIFLPCRKGSERVVHKNTRDFADIKGGLTFIKICQLLKVKKISKIIVSTNDNSVIRIAQSFNDDKIVIDNRPEELASSATSTDDLIRYIPTIIQEGMVLWTHVTSPLIDETVYNDAIDLLLDNQANFDSLMSVTKIQKFLWDKKKPLNYNKRQEKWPRTQTIAPLYEINSGMFLADIEVYKEQSDRIGKSPYLYEISDKKSFDIDWEDDFDIAEILWKKYGRI